jgi:glucan phosphoethanolaminetransferase (alkaline phosphatase superfamily)
LIHINDGHEPSIVNSSHDAVSMMFELACLLLAFVWLYFWLSGHWFARVIAFLAMLGAAGVAGFIAFMVMPSRPGPWGDVVSVAPAPTKPD